MTAKIIHAAIFKTAELANGPIRFRLLVEETRGHIVNGSPRLSTTWPSTSNFQTPTEYMGIMLMPYASFMRFCVARSSQKRWG
jgi:hypothetical protein